MNIKTTEQTIPVTLYISAKPPASYNDDDVKRGYGITCHTFNWASCSEGAALIDTQEITITIPGDVDVLNGMVTSLKEKQQKIRAEAEVHCNVIERQIQSMLCLEYNPEEVA